MLGPPNTKWGMGVGRQIAKLKFASGDSLPFLIGGRYATIIYYSILLYHSAQLRVPRSRGWPHSVALAAFVFMLAGSSAALMTITRNTGSPSCQINLKRVSYVSVCSWGCVIIMWLDNISLLCVVWMTLCDLDSDQVLGWILAKFFTQVFGRKFW